MSAGAAPVDATCYRPATNGSITSSYDSFYLVKGTGSYSYCCFDSAVYLADGICYQSSHASDATGYYIALCTDPTYKDPSCSSACDTYSKGDIVYNNNQWLCCGADSTGDNPTCDTPTSEVVPNIPSPNQLQALATATTTSSSTSSTATSTSSSTASSSTTSGSAITPTPGPGIVSDDTSSSGLSTGAKAGIGAGVGIAALAAIIIFAFFYMRRSRRAHGSEKSRHTEETEEFTKSFNKGYSAQSSIPPAYADTGYRPQPKPSPPSELASPPLRVEPVEMGESVNRQHGPLVELG